ncbi:MAG: hypothetical protein MHM6MM_006851 [Cercozoa sp. M6MM]
MQWIVGIACLALGVRAACPFAHLEESLQSAQIPAGHPVVTSTPQFEPWLGSIPQASNTSDEWVRINQDFFLSTARRARNATTNFGSDLVPENLVFQEGDHLVLLRNKQRVQVREFTPPLFHFLKIVSHLPVSVLNVLHPQLGMDTRRNAPAKQVQLNADTLNTLIALANRVEEMDLSEVDRRFDGDLALQRTAIKIRDATVAWIRHTVERAATSFQLLKVELLNPLRNDLLEFATKAAEAQLIGLDDAFHAMLRAEFKNDVPSDLRVGVATGHMVRSDNLVSQYWSRYFGVDIHQSAKMITLEAVFDERRMWQSWAQHEHDYAMGSLFWNDGA